MPQRPDLRQISGNIREALGECDRETLLDMLTFVFKEYVVEGPPPLLVGQVERIPDLEGLSFAQLIRALQTRLDLPELGLFQVDGEQVAVRVGGVMTPLDTSRADVSRSRGAAEPAAPAMSERQRAGVHIIEAQVPMQPPPSRGRSEGGAGEQAGSQAGPSTEAPPPPRRGLSIRGRPSGGAAAPTPASRQEPAGGAGDSAGGAAARDPGSAQPAPAQPQSDDEDIASTRFSLLELD